MGNSSSGQQQQISLIEGPTHPWAHSFPRSSSFKVLPERVPGQRLRLTDNGAILHNGGTISGRKPYEQGFRQSGSDFEERRYMYSSEPDLRYAANDQHHRSRQSSNNITNYYNGNNDSSAKSRIGRSRKKYKAPTAPNINNSTESSSPDSFNQWETSGDSSEVVPVRKSRLFKTRAETKKPSDSSSRIARPNEKSSGQLQRSFSSPQFHDELTAKLKERLVREPPVGKAADSPNGSPSMTNRKEIQTRLIDNNRRDNNVNAESKRKKQINYYREENNNRKTGNYTREERMNKNHEINKNNNNNQRNHQKTEKQIYKTSVDNKIIVTNSKTTKQNEKLTNGINKENEDKAINTRYIQKTDEKPVKKFYFGMEQSEDNKSQPKLANLDNEIIDKFAESVKKYTPGIHSTSTSETVSTSDEAATGGIFLKLRPTLPRKQLDIPRFSPTAAWRLLSALESPVNSEDDDLMLMEERIPHPREINQDKSGDSGISGDASPNSAHNSQAAWTPQQDLEETSSDGGVESAPVSPESITTAKFSPRFSLSLPRDEKNDIYSYADKVRQDTVAPSSGNFQNLKKFKWSSSNGNHSKQKNAMVSSLDENWVLSRSVPNLFNPHINKRSDTSISPPDQEESSMCSLTTGKPPSLSYLATGGRVMYLPEYQSRNDTRKLTALKSEPVSKSCEDLTRHKKENNVKTHKTSSKFTFQSTIRQIERRKIAEKLSKDAEEKERKRLRELEAMQRVEEEFQRKREREKADIRQQLRLYNLTEGREQPDGAIMTNGLPATQILSEFRQPRREYRDYTTRNETDNLPPQVELNVKRETVHPEVVFQMPKSTQVYVTSRSGSASMNHTDTVSSSSASDNYRKDFAQGALSRSLVGSDCDSQPNTRPASRTKHRSRSISPVNDNDDDFNTNSQIVINQSSWDNHTYDMKITKKSTVLSESPITLPRRSMQFSLKPFTGLKTYKPINFKLDNFKRVVR